jgi:hypothetical protein
MRFRSKRNEKPTFKAIINKIVIDKTFNRNAFANREDIVCQMMKNIEDVKNVPSTPYTRNIIYNSTLRIKIWQLKTSSYITRMKRHLQKIRNIPEKDHSINLESKIKSLEDHILKTTTMFVINEVKLNSLSLGT